MRPEGRYFVSAVIAHTGIFKICYLMWPTEESHTGLEQHDFWVNYRFNIICAYKCPLGIIDAYFPQRAAYLLKGDVNDWMRVS